MRIAAAVSAQLEALRMQHLLRTRTVYKHADDDHLARFNFASNDYLGLSRHPQVLAAYAEGLKRWGAGSGASPAVTGFQPPHNDLCRQLAEWLARDNAVLFSSGFAANHCVMRTLAPFYDHVVADKLSHASLLDGMTTSAKHWQRFRHNDSEHAAKLLRANATNLLVTESVFSMDGDTAPLTDLAALPTDLWVDDAHGLGVLGENGESAAGRLTQAQLPLITATFGKGLGVMGAAIVGPSDVIELLHTRGREYIYSTAFSGAQATAIGAAVTIVQGNEGQRLRNQLSENIDYFRHVCTRQGVALQPSAHAIQIIPVGTEQRALELGNLLAAQGIVVGVIRPPTVAKGAARLRITLSAQHQQQDIDRLITEIASC